MRKFLCFLLFAMMILISTSCSGQPDLSGGGEVHDRFARAEKYGQFIPVDQSVNCKGTRVTIEKVLLDKTSTFMIAAIDGDIRGRVDSLCVDLFDNRDRELGRSSFQQKLPGDKTLLTFDPVENAPETLRLEFFGGPVGYGSGHVILHLDDIDFRTVDKKYVREYRLAKAVEKKDYRLVVDNITTGISETGIHYKLNALGNYDGIDHGWLYDWHNNYSPEGEIVFMTDDGRKLEAHLSGINCIGPYYRVSQDKKTMVGRANFDGIEAQDVQIKLTNIYGYYNMHQIIPIHGVKDRLNIDKQLPVGGYTVELKSFVRKDNETWILDYSVLDSSGKKVDAAIDAGIYMKGDNYRMCLTHFRGFKDATVGNHRLVITWQPPDSKDSLIRDPAIKITRLGIRQDDAVLDINLTNPHKPAANRDESMIMAAINEYYDTLDRALTSNDITVIEKKYGYLKPMGKRVDGINDWRKHFDLWQPKEVQEYSVSFNDPIITVHGNSASADIAGMEKILWSSGTSAGGFNVVFDLTKTRQGWEITRVDEFTESELYEIN